MISLFQLIITQKYFPRKYSRWLSSELKDWMSLRKDRERVFLEDVSSWWWIVDHKSDLRSWKNHHHLKKMDYFPSYPHSSTLRLESLGKIEEWLLRVSNGGHRVELCFPVSRRDLADPRAWHISVDRSSSVAFSH